MRLDLELRDPSDPTTSDGAWTIEDRGLNDVVLSDSGDAVRLRTGAPRWDLRWWLDDATVVGVAVSGPGKGTEVGPGDSGALMTCAVPAGSCTTIEESSGVLVRFPVGAGDDDSLGLPDGGSS